MSYRRMEGLAQLLGQRAFVGEDTAPRRSAKAGNSLDCPHCRDMRFNPENNVPFSTERFYQEALMQKLIR
jgi:hypothetical protein